MECLCPHPLVRPLSTRLGADDEGAELLHANKIKKQFPPVRNYLPILALTMEKTLCGKNQTCKWKSLCSPGRGSNGCLCRQRWRSRPQYSFPQRCSCSPVLQSHSPPSASPPFGSQTRSSPRRSRTGAGTNFNRGVLTLSGPRFFRYPKARDLRFFWKLIGRILYMHICYH